MGSAMLGLYTDSEIGRNHHLYSRTDHLGDSGLEQSKCRLCDSTLQIDPTIDKEQTQNSDLPPRSGNNIGRLPNKTSSLPRKL